MASNPSRRGFLSAVAALVPTTAVLASRAAARALEPVPLAIKGYDPVAYFSVGQPTRGRPDVAYDWDDHHYLFVSAENRDRFRANPERYAPQFANFCAMALTRGEVTEADPENWLIAGGRLYIFGKVEGPQLFQQDLPGNIAKANQNRTLLPLR